MKLSAISPNKYVATSHIRDAEAGAAIRDILRLLEAMQRDIARVVNYNEITYVAQDTQPVPDNGTTIVWKDTTAVPTTPKAYIVTMQDNNTYTFASKEVW